MAQRVTRHLRLLRQLKYLTASKTPMVSDYPRNFGNAAKDGLKGTTRWAVYYLTNPISWYPVLERAMILSAISAIQPLLPLQPGEPVSLERSDFEEQQENSRKQDEKEDGILEHDSPSVMIVTFHLWNERLIFTREDENQLRKKYSLQQRYNGCHAFATGH
ncbi:unnamed protein product [Pocillopora meandrina]|uniref:Uncharacterized protein n=1 Tax=Pocillopora meandrina TaxID=46732 RepID=A0AAU9XLC5_9CNID|nr:unnamed protein product [Pocillopora meandrina]